MNSILKIADALDLDLCLCKHVPIQENVSENFTETSNKENTVYSRTIVSVLNNFFESNNISLDQKNNLEAKMKDLLFQEIQKLL